MILKLVRAHLLQTVSADVIVQLALSSIPVLALQILPSRRACPNCIGLDEELSSTALNLPEDSDVILSNRPKASNPKRGPQDVFSTFSKASPSVSEMRACLA